MNAPTLPRPSATEMARARSTAERWASPPTGPLGIFALTGTRLVTTADATAIQQEIAVCVDAVTADPDAFSSGDAGDLHALSALVASVAADGSSAATLLPRTA